MADTQSNANRDADVHENALLDRLLAGDEAAFLALVRLHHGALVRVAQQFVSDPAAAEDVAQDTWIAVLRGLPGFQRKSRFKTWLFHILANRAKTLAIREKRMVPFSALGDAALGETAVDPARFTVRGMWAEPLTARRDAEAALGDNQLVAFIEKTMVTLPANQRLVVTLRDVDGLSGEEVCNVLDISETNQRVLLHRGRSRLRAALERHLRGTP